jgi:hypothetical protein
LSDRAHRNWFNLNCVANAHGGVLPCLEDVALKLRTTEARAAAAIAELVAKRLFDKREDGSFVPHDWNDWQFKSDASDATNADRQRKFRKQKAEEWRQLKALRNANNGALRNGVSHGVTDVTAKRPETESNLNTTTENVERGLSKGSIPVSSELAALLQKRGTA